MRHGFRFLILTCIAISGRGAEPVIPPVPQPDVLYFLQPDGNRLIAVEQQPASLLPVMSFYAADLKGSVSSTRFLSTRPTFVIRRNWAPHKMVDRLMLIDSANGKRTMTLSLSPQKALMPLPDKNIEMEYWQSGPNTYALRPLRPLAPGEYCMYFGRYYVAFLFGVDPSGAAPTDNIEGSQPVAPAPHDDKRRILDSLLLKKLITEEDYRAKVAELDAPAVAPGPEERLRKLDALYKKGLISQPDYQKKRAEILAEI